MERFFKERVEPTLSSGIGEAKTAGDVQAFFDRGRAGLPTAGSVTAQGRQRLSQVQGAAAGAGVDPHKAVASQLPQQVAATQGRAQQALEAGKGNVESQGKPLEETVRNQTAPGTQPLLGIATTNAVAQVLPDGGSSLMMEKLPGVNMSVGTPGSAAAEAAAERSRQGHPRDPVTQSLILADDAIDRGVGAVLPGTVNHALDQTKVLGEQKIGEIIGTRQPQASAPSPLASGVSEAKTVGDGSDVLGGTWTLGESKIGELIGTNPATTPRPAEQDERVERPGRNSDLPPVNR